jgi:hypothetical protein
MISTSGFTFYTHYCDHHEKERSIVNIDDCCAEPIREIQEQHVSCCEAETNLPANSCGDEHGEGCCFTDVSYIKLDTHFVQSEQEELPTENANELILAFQVSEYHQAFADISDDDRIEIKIPPPLPIYRLFNNVKTEPPLI